MLLPNIGSDSHDLCYIPLAIYTDSKIIWKRSIQSMNLRNLSKFDLRDWLPNKDKAELGLDFTRVLNVSYAMLWQNNWKGEIVDPT